MSEKLPNNVRETLTPTPPPIISCGKSRRRILCMLKKGLNLTRISICLNCSKSNVSEHLKAMWTKGWVFKKNHKWFISEVGKRLVNQEFGFLEGYEREGVVITDWIQDRGHNIKAKIKVLSKPNKDLLFCGWAKTDTQMQNQKWRMKRFDNLIVKYTGLNIIIQLPIIRAKDSELANLEANRIINTLLGKIEKSATGLKLGTFELDVQIFTQHHAIPYEPISKTAKQYNLSYKDDKIDIDASDTPELEFTDPKTADKDFMRYVEYAKDFSTNDVLKPSEVQDLIKQTQLQIQNMAQCQITTNAQIQTLVNILTPKTYEDNDKELLRRWTT